MGRSIIPIGAAVSEVKEFFSGEVPFVAAFTVLAIHTWLIDQRVGVHRERNIIGISRSDSHYYFYITIRDEDYYIKFKSREEKEPFDIDKIDLYKDYCRDAAFYINNMPGCILSESYSEPNYDELFPREKKILEDSQELLRSLGEMSLPEDLFGARAYNALVGAGIQTCADLVGKSVKDLLEIKNFGKSSLKATCIALLVLAHKDASEYECEIESKSNNDNEALMEIRERTGTLVAEQEARVLCDSDESMDAALNFLKNFSVIVENLIKNAKLVTERSTKIICARVFDKRSLADIAEDYNLSRERIRQICQKVTDRIKEKISQCKIPTEYADAISNLILDIEDGLYLDCLLMVRENDEFLWDVLSCIVADEEDQILLNDFLESCNEISPSVIQDFEPRVERKIEQKKTYREWQYEEPNVVLLVKSGYFYTAYGPSAEVLNSVLDYKLFYTAKNLIPTTGGPDLAKIQCALEDADISYAVIIDGVIEIRFDGSKGITDYVKVDNRQNELLEAIEMMQQGIDPETGEILDEESFLFSDNVQKILNIAKAEVLRRGGNT